MAFLDQLMRLSDKQATRAAQQLSVLFTPTGSGETTMSEEDRNAQGMRALRQQGYTAAEAREMVKVYNDLYKSSSEELRRKIQEDIERAKKQAELLDLEIRGKTAGVTKAEQQAYTPQVIPIETGAGITEPSWVLGQKPSFSTTGSLAGGAGSQGGPGPYGQSQTEPVIGYDLQVNPATGRLEQTVLVNGQPVSAPTASPKRTTPYAPAYTSPTPEAGDQPPYGDLHVARLRAAGLEDLANDLAKADDEWRRARTDEEARAAQIKREGAARKFDAARAGTPLPSSSVDLEVGEKRGTVTPAQRIQIQTLKNLWATATRKLAEAQRTFADESEITRLAEDENRARQMYLNYIEMVTGAFMDGGGETVEAPTRVPTAESEAGPGSTAGVEEFRRRKATGATPETKVVPVNPLRPDERLTQELRAIKDAGYPRDEVEAQARQAFAAEPDKLDAALRLIAGIWGP